MKMKNNLRIKLFSSVVIFLSSLYFWVDGEIYSGFGFTVASLLLILPELFRKRWPRFPSIMMVLAIFLSTVSVGFFIHAKTVKERSGLRASDVIMETPDRVSEKTNKTSDQDPPGASASGPDTPKEPQQFTVQETLNTFFTTGERNNADFQKMMKIVSSEEFQHFLSQSDDPLTLGELASFFVSQGMTEWEGIDFDNLLSEGYEASRADYIARNNGKAPETDDNVKSRQLSELIKQLGKTQGLAEFAKNEENIEWIAVRFKGDQKAFKQWLHAATYPLPLPADDAAPPVSSAPVEVFSHLQENTSNNEEYQKEDNTTDDVVEATQSQHPQEFDDASRYKNVDEPTDVSLPLILTKSGDAKDITDGSLELLLSEKFSPERINRAMKTLNQYGPQEGLRRLKSSDPEVAKQVERLLPKRQEQKK